MEIKQIKGEPRDVGKTATRRIRNQGDVPCVLYSRNVDPVVFKMPAIQLKRLAFSRQANQVEVAVGDQSWNCILKDVELHPITDTPIHADFQVLQEGERVTLTVPVRFLGTPIGQTEGGDTQFSLTEIRISCLPKDIPSNIEVDISELDIGDALHVSDLDVEGVKFEMNPGQTLAVVVAPRVEPVTTTAAATEEELLEEGELVETEEGEPLPEGEEAPEEEEEQA